MSEHSTAVDTGQEATPPAVRQARQVRPINVGNSERWLSVIGGGALVLYGLRRSLGNLALALGGGALVYRGMSGHCAVYERLGLNTVSRQDRGVAVEAAITVNKPVAEVYRFYRNLENHPRFVTHLESVRATDPHHSHWVAKTPFQKTIEWDARIVEERQNDMLSWRSLPGSDVEHTGTARFRELADNRGTEVHVSLNYSPPGGGVGAALAKLFGMITTHQLREDLRRFKQLLEAGEQPTTANQPVGHQG